MKSYFWRKTKWFWTHPMWLCVLAMFFVQSFLLLWAYVPYISGTSLYVVAGALTLIFSFISSSAMTCVDLCRGYHRKQE